MTVKEEYNILLEAGDLETMCPSLTGDWSEDKKSFTRMWEDNQKAILDINVDLNLDYDED